MRTRRKESGYASWFLLVTCRQESATVVGQDSSDGQSGQTASGSQCWRKRLPLMYPLQSAESDLFYTLFIWCMKRDPTLKSEGRSFISLELRTSNPRPSRSRFVREILRDCRGLGCFQLPPVASGLRSRSAHFSGAGCCRDLHSASYRISFPPTAMDRGMEGVVRFQILMFHERRGSHFEHSASA